MRSRTLRLTAVVIATALAVQVFAFAGEQPFPSEKITAWMVPGAFHLSIGMKQPEAFEALRKIGFKAAATKVEHQFIVEYGADRTVTLGFEDNRLQSIRFELVGFIPKVKDGFAERREELIKAYGPPRETSTPSILLFDKQMPQVHLVLSTSHTDDFGKQGLGFLVVRYFVPPAEPVAPERDTPGEETTSTPR